MGSDVQTEPLRDTAGSLASILHPPSTARSAGCRLDNDTSRDLALDQLIARLVEGRAEYALTEDFTRPLRDGDEIRYRQDVFRDLEDPAVRASIGAFGDRMGAVRRSLNLVANLHYGLERQRWLLDAAAAYTACVTDLAGSLNVLPLKSAALRAMSDTLRAYIQTRDFQDLARTSAEVLAQLDAVRYRLRIHGGSVQVSAVRDDEPDYTAAVVETFARFRQGGTKSYLSKVTSPGSMDHVEAAIAGFVARLFPAAFQALRGFSERHQDLIDPQVALLDRESQFYLAYLDVMDRLRPGGVSFCHPDVEMGGELAITDGVDIVLALKATGSGHGVIPNDCALSPRERLVVVTGPNQGGKTTFARMMGQLHYLTSLGVPVPARQATIPSTDRIFTLFERGENLDDQRGHLHDDLVRARHIVTHAGPDSLVLLNEVFSSTSLEDAVFLGGEVLTRLRRKGPRCVCVTFLDELTTLSDDTVSMVAEVDAADPILRTFEIVRRPADGLAYADALADKHRLSYQALTERLGR